MRSGTPDHATEIQDVVGNKGSGFKSPGGTGAFLCGVHLTVEDR